MSQRSGSRGSAGAIVAALAVDIGQLVAAARRRPGGRRVAGCRNKRLDRCRRDLADPRLATESILTIASGWGFANAAHFSRSFSRAFGESPRNFRAAACRAIEPAPPVRDR